MVTGMLRRCLWYPEHFFLIVLIACFTSYFVISIAILPHSPGVVYYHASIAKIREFPGLPPFSF